MRQTRLGITREDGARQVLMLRELEQGVKVWVVSGWQMPTITQATIEASPGIQAWSSPRGKVATKLFDGGATILSFSDYCKRHLLPTYPLTRGRDV